MEIEKQIIESYIKRNETENAHNTMFAKPNTAIFFLNITISWISRKAQYKVKIVREFWANLA